MWQHFSSHEFTIENIQKQYFMMGVSLRSDWIQEMISNGIQDFSVLEKNFLKTNIGITSEPNREFSNFMQEYSITSQDFIVQIDEVVDIGLPYVDRIEMKRDPNGTLKFLLNSGGTQFIGLEKTKLGPNFTIGRITPGTKLLISKGSEIRYGVLFLTPENAHILGGKADDLISQRKYIYESVPINSSNDINSQASQASQDLYNQQFSIKHEDSDNNDKSIINDENAIDLLDLLYSNLIEDQVYLCKAKVDSIFTLYLDGNLFIYIVAVKGTNGGTIKALIDQNYAMKLLEISSANEWRNLGDYDASVRQENSLASLLKLNPPIKLMYKPNPKLSVDYVLLE